MNPSSSSLYMCEFLFFGNIWSWAIIPSTDLLTIGAFKDRSWGQGPFSGSTRSLRVT